MISSSTGEIFVNMVKRELTEEVGLSVGLSGVSLKTTRLPRVKMEPVSYSFMETELETPHELLTGETKCLGEFNGNQAPGISRRDNSTNYSDRSFYPCMEPGIPKDSKECVCTEEHTCTSARDEGVVVNTGLDSDQRALYWSARYQPVVKLERNPLLDGMIGVEVSPAISLDIGEISHGDQNLQVKHEQGFKFWSIGDTIVEAQGVFSDRIMNQNIPDTALRANEADITVSFVKQEPSHEEQDLQVKIEPDSEWPTRDIFPEAQDVPADMSSACDIDVQEPDAEAAWSGGEVNSTLGLVKVELSHKELSPQVKIEPGSEWSSADKLNEAQRLSADKIMDEHVPDLLGSTVDPIFFFVQEELPHKGQNQVKTEPGSEWPTGDILPEAQVGSGDLIMNGACDISFENTKLSQDGSMVNILQNGYEPVVKAENSHGFDVMLSNQATQVDSEVEEGTLFGRDSLQARQEKGSGGSEFQVMLDSYTGTKREPADRVADMETMALSTGVRRPVRGKLSDTGNQTTAGVRNKAHLDKYSCAKFQPVVRLERIPTGACSIPHVESCPLLYETDGDNCQVAGLNTARVNSRPLRSRNIARVQPEVSLQSTDIPAPDQEVLSSRFSAGRESSQREREAEGQRSRDCEDRLLVTSTVYQQVVEAGESPAVKIGERGTPNTSFGGTVSQSCDLNRLVTADSSKRLHSCNICKKHLLHLKEHMKVHRAKTLFTCNECSKSFTVSGELREHMELMGHLRKYKRYQIEVEKPFKCDSCGKRYKSSTRLREHIRMHTDNKPYICDVCQKGFTKQTDKRMHMKLHKGENAHICYICKKSFDKNDAHLLIEHMRLHKR